MCDRVAILRKGRLVEVGTLDDLRKLNTQEVEIEFAAGAGARPVGRRRACRRCARTAAGSRCG